MCVRARLHLRVRMRVRVRVRVNEFPCMYRPRQGSVDGKLCFAHL